MRETTPMNASSLGKKTLWQTKIYPPGYVDASAKERMTAQWEHRVPLSEREADILHEAGLSSLA